MIFPSLHLNLFVFLASFVVIWFAAGLVVSEIKHLSRYLKLSTFTLSFFVLGLLTSLPEIAIGFSSITSGQPEILIGTLIGGSIVLFLFIIPLLAITGNGLRYPKELSRSSLIFTLVVVVAPTLLVSDRQISVYEALILIGLYFGLFLVINKRLGLVENLSKHIIHKKHHLPKIVLKINTGLLLLYFSSQEVVQLTEFFSHHYHWSEFVVSLLVVSVGANIPEISLVIRSVIHRDKSIAFADYLGSAVANTAILGFFVVIYGTTIVLPNHFIQRFVFLFAGLLLFYFFAKSKQRLSRNEGFVLLLLYFGFVIAELMIEGIIKQF